jgi:hypothetical protein
MSRKDSRRVLRLSGQVALLLGFAACAGAAAPEPPAPAAPPGAAPPGFSLSVTGGPHDFDFLIGAWTTKQKRLKARGVGNSDWSEAPANRHCALAYLDGIAIVEESRFPDQAPAGLFLYGFNPAKHQWSIYWVNAKTGQPDSGVFGGFAGSRGEFYGADVDNGRPIRVRWTWTSLDHDHARWEQAFSFDDHTWETNWISDLTRVDAAICHKSL